MQIAYMADTLSVFFFFGQFTWLQLPSALTSDSDK